MIFKNRTQARKETGLNYLGSVSKTVKHKKSIKYGELTYSLYLSPAKTSGYEVCPGRCKECTRLCLNESGMNKMNMKGEMINKSRIAKTKMFFENNQYFIDWLFYEIKLAKAQADKLGFTFSVRLNNTSDISPEDFYTYINCQKINILDYFKDITFYDYTKVYSRMELLTKYQNYNLTYSFTGYNWANCMEVLKSGNNVAMVFKTVPEIYKGYKVINGDLNDLRYKDSKGVIVGLKFKQIRIKLPVNTKFVIQ